MSRAPTPVPDAATQTWTVTWAALGEAGAVVAALAGIEPGPGAGPLQPVDESTGGWRHALVAQGVEDLAAVMKPGLAALLAAHARGAVPTAAARALWREFAASRDALMALACPEPPSGA